MDRELDGIFFRIERDGEWESVCFSDMTDGQMQGVLECRDKNWLIGMCVLLGRKIREICDSFDIGAGGKNDTN